MYNQISFDHNAQIAFKIQSRFKTADHSEMSVIFMNVLEMSNMSSM